MNVYTEDKLLVGEGVPDMSPGGKRSTLPRFLVYDELYPPVGMNSSSAARAAEQPQDDSFIIIVLSCQQNKTPVHLTQIRR